MVMRELDRREPPSPTDHCTGISTIGHVNIGWKIIAEVTRISQWARSCARQGAAPALCATPGRARPIPAIYKFKVYYPQYPTSPSRFGVSMDTENGQMSIVNTGEHPDPHMNIATPGWTFRPVVDIGGPR